MAEFVVNVTLIVALFVLLVVWAVSASRRRRRDRREHAQERRLILGAFTSAAGGAPAADYDEDLKDVHAELDPRAQAERPVRRSRSEQASRTSARISASRPVGAAAQQLDPASIVALLDLLEDRQPARRGAFASLFTSPGSVWSAGTRAGQSVARNTTGDPGRGQQTDDTVGAQLYREAAGELVDIYAHDPGDARAQYARFAAALGDPALAELYVRSAVYSAQIDSQRVASVANGITHGPQAGAASAVV